MALKFFREDPCHGRGKKTRKEGPMGTLLLPQPSWAWLELAPIMLVEPSTACTSEAATISPSARDMLSGKVGSRWAKRSTPTSLQQAQFERRGSFLSITYSARRGQASCELQQQEGNGKALKQQSATVPGERFQDVVCPTDTPSQRIQPQEQPCIPPDLEMRRRDNASKLVVSREPLRIISLRIC